MGPGGLALGLGPRRRHSGSHAADHWDSEGRGWHFDLRSLPPGHGTAACSASLDVLSSLPRHGEAAVSSGLMGVDCLQERQHRALRQCAERHDRARLSLDSLARPAAVAPYRR